MNKTTSLIAEQMSGQRKRLVILTLLSLLLGIAIVSQAGLLAEAVQRVFVERASLSSVALLLALLLSVMAIRTLLVYANGRVGLTMAADAKANMRSAVLQKLTHASIPSTLRGQTGGKVSVALDAVDEADSYFSHYMPRMAEAAIIPVLILAVTFILHANTGFILLFTAPFIPLFMILVGMQTKNKSEEKYEQLAEFSGTFLDSLQGLVTLKIFGQSRRQQQQIERSSLGYRDATMDILKVAFTNTFMLESIVMLGIGIVALELAIQLLVFKSMPFHTAFLVLLLVPEFFNLLKNTGTAFHSGRTSMGAVRKVEQMLADISGGTGTQPEGGGQSSAKLLRMPPSIALDDVHFHYAPGSFELKAGPVSIEPGQHVAIVGHSGSGKTTLLHLIAGLLKPVSGTVRVDGSPLTGWEEDSWFEQMSYITQHPYIFAGTFADNIAIGAGRKVFREEIRQAAEDAGLAPLIAGLEQGLDTHVGEGGRGLSGGEKQRLALARAFLKRPALILFDEPTVGLDLQTEQILQSSITELARKATMITVAHRLYTIRQADHILFMEHGVLAAAGPHDELLERVPQYAEMVDIQRKGGSA
ncbi:thiol reductant ABC exporter subunit CydD [Paenibacillus sp. FSL H7-0350]|uniref:thiol reductant ABC exporter subunit CydD n=1 Tax=Paenibacillus sp. FSL H7-0350 TaxID=2975345 RepID=UPI00315986A0